MYVENWEVSHGPVFNAVIQAGFFIARVFVVKECRGGESHT